MDKTNGSPAADMTLNDYQRQALTTALWQHNELLDLSHWSLGLCGESGEVAEKVKKIIRDQASEVTADNRQAIAKELGDVLWYLAVLAHQLGVSLDEIAAINLAKLQQRQSESKLTGNGDDR